MSEFNHDEVMMCVCALSRAENPSEAVMAWSLLQGKYSHFSAMVALSDYEQAALPSAVKKYFSNSKSFLVPYLVSEKIYFLDDELLGQMFSAGEFKFGIDYTFMFDTNIATYINKLVRGESLGDVQSKIVRLLDDVLYDDMNFDHLFYMAENVKNVLSKIERRVFSKASFWFSLDKAFRQNLVSLQLFSSIDGKEYKRTSNPRPTLAYPQAVRDAIEFAYGFYASEMGKDQILNFVLVQRLILLQLIGMVKIQLSSRKGGKYKMCQYLKYIHVVVGAYFERETIIAHKYFVDRNSLPILEKIKKGCGKTRLLKKLDNIAWDMAAPRFMERLLSIGGKGRYFIPMFLTFDANLRNLLSHFSVKGVLINKDTGAVLPIPVVNSVEYFQGQGLGAEFEHFGSTDALLERKARAKPTRMDVQRLIRREYRELRALV